MSALAAARHRHAARVKRASDGGFDLLARVLQHAVRNGDISPRDPLIPELFAGWARR